MTVKVIATIQGCDIILHDDGHISFLADADIDCDGSGGNPDHDPYFQPDTTLHRNCEPLNAYQERFIVVPPIIITSVPGIVLGSQARVHYRQTGLIVPAVVGDIGPRVKVGELSVACARDLGMACSPINGGEDDFRMVLYELWPDKPAIVEGIQYPLQPHH